MSVHTFEATITASIPPGSYLVADGEDLGFSWYPCDLCRRPLGGDRHKVIALTTTAPVVVTGEYDACTDCLMFAAYGDLPDDLTPASARCVRALL